MSRPRLWPSAASSPASASCLSEDDDYTGVDLDNCRDPATGKLDLWADDIVCAWRDVLGSESERHGTSRLRAREDREDGQVRHGARRGLSLAALPDDHRRAYRGHARGHPPRADDARMAHGPRGAVRAEGQSRHSEPPNEYCQEDISAQLRATHNDAGERAWAEAALERDAAELAACGEGGRNHALNAKAYRMGRMVARGWIEKSRVEAALTDACRANGLFKDDGPKGDTRHAGERLARRHGQALHADLKDDAPRRRRRDLAEGNRIAGRLIAMQEGVSYDAETGEIVEGVKPKAGQRIKLKATPYSWPDCASIQPREWLFGKQLIRKFVSATIAPSGVGKSSLIIAEALSMVSGRALLHGIRPTASLNVWIWNGEDPIDELNRRIAATAKHYGIKREECPGRLFVDSGRNLRLVVAETIKGGTVVARPVIDAIKATVSENKIDVLVIDPFVSCHRVSENDNSAIDTVAREWADIADATGCAVELVHHVRKVGDVEVTVEDARGASALL